MAEDLVNNVHLNLLKETEKKARSQNNSFPTQKVIKGRLTLNGSPEFEATVSSSVSRFTFQTDEPPALGGTGVNPTPLTYLLFGLVSCYATSLANQCALSGIKLEKLEVTGVINYDLGPVVTESSNPIVKDITLKVNADREIGKQIKEARKHCPSLFAIENPIRTEIIQE
jgi:uncharacterized OsmC-like protein